MKPWPSAAALVLTGVFSLPLLAESCYVTSESKAQGPAGIRAETCFEHLGMPPGSLDWSCGDREALGVTKRKQASCPAGYFGKCSAGLTQETLANEASSGRVAPGTALPTPVPEGARIVTYHYRAADQSQARIDCEHGGGHWSP